MGRVKVLTALSFTLVHLWAMVSCQNELLPVPTGIKEQTSREAAPEHFVASHGRQKIHLSWSPVAGAQGYRIYASDLMTPTEESFVQVTYVTQSETPVAEIDVKPGSEAWYRVSAILSNGSETVASKSLRATSLATPEITDIQTDSDDATVLTVYWNMSNCRDDTYRKQTEYTITCISSIDTVSRTVKATQLQETCFTMTGLMAHTSYSCKITARTEFGDESESSEISAETLHQLQPHAPIALSGSQGDDKDGITLSFKLPEKADLQRKDDGTFEKAPIKFTVYRRALGDESWAKISDNPGIKKSDGSSLTAANYPDDGGLDVSWKDTNVPQRGLIYEYKVQSYVDLAAFMADPAHNIASTSDLKAAYNYIETSSTVSSATTSGWRMAQPKLSTRNYEPTPSESEPGTYSSASLGLSFSWNNFLLESSVANSTLAAGYKFLLYETMSPFDCDPGKTGRTCMVKSFSSIAEVNEYTQTFNLAGGSSGARGMYSYTVYIVSESAPVPEIGSTTLPSDYYDKIESAPPIAVSDNAGTIEDFEVRGGYKDKFIISWKNQSGTTYSLTYTELVDGETVVSDVEVFSNRTVSGSTGTETDEFTQSSGSHGIERIYRLTATAGSSSAPISETRFAYSLGCPEPKFDSSNPYYDTITVRWEDVQAAESYKVQLAEDTPVEITTEGENANTRVSTDALGNKVYSYTFTEDQLGSRCRAADVSGTNMAVKVFATSVVDDTTAASVEARTLGPAQVGLETSVAQYYKSIMVGWKAVEGANAYQILRKRYTSNGSGGWMPDEDEWETFTFDPQTGNVVSNGEPYSAMTVTLSGDKYILKDSHAPIPAADKDSASQNARTQARIPWGIPIEYMVIPLRSTGDSFDGTKLSSSSLTVEGKKLSYTGLVSDSDFIKKGSTVGYGLNVHAAKAESSREIQIKWTQPYTGGKSVKPLIYRRLKSSSEIYTKNQIVDSSRGLKVTDTEHPQPCSTNEERTKPFEYAVKYIATSSDDSDSTQNAEQNNPFVESYTDALSEIPDTNGEPLAVGYLFHLPQFNVNNVINADGSEGFSESVNWSDWNYTERKNGPEDLDGKPAYTVWTKNKNNSSGWFQIASINRNGEVSFTQDPGWYETDIERSATGLTLTPSGVNNSTGTNNGLLKVQRDYRHYYMIRAQRVNSEGKTIYTYIGLDGNTWTYRRISAEEFAKNVLLIVADANHIAGQDTNSFQGKQGTFSTTVSYHSWSVPVYYDFTYNFDSYIHKFTKCIGDEREVNSYLLLTSSKAGSGRSYDKKHYNFGESTFSVSGADEAIKNATSYQGSVTFSAGKPNSNYGITYYLEGNYTVNEVKRDLPTIEDNKAQFESWFPFLLGGDLSKQDRSSYDTDYPCCNGSWWQVRDGGKENSEFKTEAE